MYISEINMVFTLNDGVVVMTATKSVDEKEASVIRISIKYM